MLLHCLINFWTTHRNWRDVFKEKLRSKASHALLFTWWFTVFSISITLNTGHIVNAAMANNGSRKCFVLCITCYSCWRVQKLFIFSCFAHELYSQVLHNDVNHRQKTVKNAMAQKQRLLLLLLYLNMIIKIIKRNTNY